MAHPRSSKKSVARESLPLSLSPTGSIPTVVPSFACLSQQLNGCCFIFGNINCCKNVQELVEGPSKGPGAVQCLSAHGWEAASTEVLWGLDEQ